MMSNCTSGLADSNDVKGRRAFRSRDSISVSGAYTLSAAMVFSRFSN